MYKFKVPTLNKTTPKESQDKLVSALKLVKGVQGATLCLDTNEFEIKPTPDQGIKSDELMAASQKAGFQVSTVTLKKK